MTSLFRILICAIFLITASFTRPAHAVCSNNEDGIAGVEGEIEFFTPENVLRYCDNTDWIDMVDISVYLAKAVTFDGTNDYLIDSTASYTASKSFTISMWLKKDTLGVMRRPFSSNNNDLDLRITATDTLYLNFKASGPGDALIFWTSSAAISDTNWHHFLISADINGADPTNILLYVDDVAQAITVNTINDTTMEFDSSSIIIGDDVTSTSWEGDIADFWIDFGTYIDLSVEANRRDFIDANGLPVNLGSDGSTPTGSAPDIFLSGDVDTWHTNKGTGGGFTEIGALTDAGYVYQTDTGTCPNTGTYFYNFTDDVMQWCTETDAAFNMHNPASGTGGCTSPTASEGALNYDTDRFKACDGNGWIDIGK